MKIKPSSFLGPVVTACMLGLGGATVRADYTTRFLTPPYALNRTVIGVDGWDHRLPTTEDRADTARVVAVRWDDYRPALVLKGANLKNTIAPTKSEQCTITFDLAVAFPDAGPTGKQFRLGFGGAPCGEIFMDLSPAGGLGYAADGSGRGGVVALAKGEVKVNSYYTFTVVIDYRKMTYEMTITGVKRDGSDFRHHAEEVAFESTKSKGVSGIYLLSGGALTGYLREVGIEAR